MGAVILVDREDFVGLGFQESLFYRKWVPGEPDAIAYDYADIPADGPFLIRANDDAVWLSHDGQDWIKIATNTRHDGPEQRRWSVLATKYAESEGLSLRNLTFRIKGLRRLLSKKKGQWHRWDVVYRWPDGSDLIWSALAVHTHLETQEHMGKQEVRYVGR